MDLKECLVQEYTVDWGNPFNEKIVYVKTPMRLEDFDEKEVMEIKMQELSKIAYDISVDMGYSTHDETVTISMPYSNLRYLSVTNKNKEEKNMPIYMNNYDLPDELKKRLGLQTKGPDKKPEWIEGLPVVAKVEIFNDRAIKMTFIDGTFTKAVCSENDIFNLDVGITICAMKRLLGTNSDNATKLYNKFINHVHDVMDRNEKMKYTVEAQIAKEKAKKRKAELKKAAKKLKAKEEQIDIQKQAIIRAHQEMEAMDQ